jgi:hypothetical protein
MNRKEDAEVHPIRFRSPVVEIAVLRQLERLFGEC